MKICPRLDVLMSLFTPMLVLGIMIAIAVERQDEHLGYYYEDEVYYKFPNKTYPPVFRPGLNKTVESDGELITALVSDRGRDSEIVKLWALIIACLFYSFVPCFMITDFEEDFPLCCRGPTVYSRMQARAELELNSIVEEDQAPPDFRDDRIVI